MKLSYDIQPGGFVRVSSASASPVRLAAGDLRRLIRGNDQSSHAATSGLDQLTLLRLVSSSELGLIEIDGTKLGSIAIVPDGSDVAEPGASIINLKAMSSAAGRCLPRIRFRNCAFAGWLDARDSRFSTLELIDCSLPGFVAEGTLFSGDLIIDGCRGSNNAEARAGQPKSISQCQLILRRTKIEGSIDVRRSRFADSGRGGWRGMSEPVPTSFAADLFQSTISGSVEIDKETVFWGGIRFRQSRIGRSLELGARIHAPALNPREGLGCAIDMMGLTVDGNLTWHPSRTEAPNEANVLGEIDLSHAQVRGDVDIQGASWPEATCSDSGLTASSTDMFRTGGIDARFLRVRGQFRIGGDCRIGRRARPNAGLLNAAEEGPSVDLWKAEIDGGLRLETGSTLNGPLLLNSSTIKKHAHVGSTVLLHTGRRPRLSPYHTVLDLSDARVDGSVFLKMPRLNGRVSMARAHINGHLEIRNLNIDLKDIRRGNYLHRWESSLEPEMWRKARFREMTDETSVIDMQDLHVTGGINLKRDAISIECPRNSWPHNRFVVDLRGMSCATWDDAESTCWKALAVNEAERTPWRIRFDGITFKALETSTQYIPLLGDHHGQGLVAQRLSAGRRARQMLSLRLAALSTFEQNQNPEPWRVVLENGGSPTRRFGTWRRILSRVVGRRSIGISHSPQPYEMFARGYMLRGEGDTATSLAMERVRQQWRWRLHRLHLRWLPVYAFGLTLLGLLAFVDHGLPRQIQLPLLGFAGTALAGPLLLHLTVWLWRISFGFGLHSGRALLSLTIFILISAFGTPLLVGERDLEWRDSVEHLSYAFDKLVPLINFGQALYNPVACVQTRDSGRLLPTLRPISDGVGEAPSTPVALELVGRAELPPVHAFPPPRPCLYRAWDRFLDATGWVFFSLAVLTFSGLLRRDIDRSAG